MDKLGIELPLLLTQIVNFTIMLAILTKLLYKPILRSLEERRKKIAEGLAFAENAKVEEEKLRQKHEKMLVQVRDEVKGILDNAKKDGKKLKEEIIAEGKAELAQQKTRQEKELKAKYEEMEKDLKRETVDIAAEMVKRLLGSMLTDEKQHQLISKQLHEIERQHEKR